MNVGSARVLRRVTAELLEVRRLLAAVLVQDIETRLQASSEPANLTAVGDAVYFAASDHTGGDELWRTDGTELGTYRVKDINPGFGGSSPQNLTAADGALYFRAWEPFGGYELWRSDGTATGTVRVSDLNPGVTGSFPEMLTPTGNGLFFTATPGALNVTHLHYSGGATGETVSLASWQAFWTRISNLSAANGTLFFTAPYEAHDAVLWKSDGTVQGTSPLLGPDPSQPITQAADLVTLGSKVYFRGHSAASGAELYTSDGTDAGTTRVTDIVPTGVGSGSSYPEHLTSAGGILYFVATGPDGFRKLWKSDGTETGTVSVADFPSGRWPADLTAVGGRLFFTLDTGTQLWKTDGSPESTVRLDDGDRPRTFKALGEAQGGALLLGH
jgi:ELWxxDGT repeat protein